MASLQKLVEDNAQSGACMQPDAFAQSGALMQSGARLGFQPLIIERRPSDAPGLPLIKETARQHKLIVLRGFEPLTEDQFVQSCSSWGEMLRWPFGYVLNLFEHSEPSNYLFTSGKVPFHWDGAFTEQVPEFQIFQCLSAPSNDCGGETLFSDTTALVNSLTKTQRDLFSKISITYHTERVAHYGGKFTSPLICSHIRTGEPVLRFGEPADELTSSLNPFKLTTHGVLYNDEQLLFHQLRELLYAPQFCYSHQWQTGDFLIADNFSLLHGRNPFTSKCGRHIQRIHVL